MSILDFTKKKELQKISELEAEIENLRSLACPDAQQLYALKAEISALESKKIDITTEINNLSNQSQQQQNGIDYLANEIIKLNKEVQKKKEEIIWMDDEIMVQEFGLYTPQYDFASALDYKEELAKIRAKQKELIKDDKAANGFTN